MVLLIDNYDSFSYNLYQALGALCAGWEKGEEIRVVRNDEITVEGIRALRPTHLVLSPGPGHPRAAGVCMDAARRLAGELPILGVCLGHQAIGEAWGGRVAHAPRLMHGKTSAVELEPSCPLFAGLPKTVRAARYHSLVVERESLPACLTATAFGPEGQLMGLRHREYPVFGIQFHPESFLTEHGSEILANFLHF